MISYDSNNFSTNPEIIKNYDLIKRTGLLDYVDKLSHELKNYEELLSLSIDIFNKHSIEELIDYVSSILQEKFLPASLTFIYEDKKSSNNIKTILYSNLKKEEDNEIEITSLKPYQGFFNKYPNAIIFSLFEYKINNPKVISELEKLEPEIIVPIRGIGGFHGFIILGKKIISKDYDQNEIGYIDKIMKFTSIALQTNIHYKHAILDQKTLLFNHSHFMHRFDEELGRINRFKGDLSLLMMDLDKFKSFNDRYGHIAGDKAIINMARVLEKSIRKIDIAARFGGEEFIVLLLNCSQKDALVVAERIRTSVENMQILYENSVLGITVSIGGIHINENYKMTCDEIIQAADSALYKCKEQGRNKTIFYEPGLYRKAINYKKQ